jgi:hypothetical protein
VKGVGRRMLGVAVGRRAKGLCVVRRVWGVGRRGTCDGGRALVV